MHDQSTDAGRLHGSDDAARDLGTIPVSPRGAADSDHDGVRSFDGRASDGGVRGITDQVADRAEFARGTPTRQGGHGVTRACSQTHDLRPGP